MNPTNLPSPAAPYVVIDSQTHRVVYRTTYANRIRARRYADRKDQEYGAVRYYCQLETLPESKLGT